MAGAVLLLLTVVTACGGTGPVGAAPVATVNGHRIYQDEVVDLVDAQTALLEAQRVAATKAKSAAQEAGQTTENEEAAIESLDDMLDGFGGLTIETATASEFVTALVEIEILSGVLSDAGLEISQADRDEQTEVLAEKLKTEQQIDDMEPFDALVRLEIERNLLYEKVTEAASSTDDYEAQLRAAYEESADSLEELCVHIIVTEDQATAQAAYDRVNSGEDFSAVATEVSIDDTSAPGGGDIGCIPRAGIANVFGEVATTAKPGDLLAPADGEGSWLVIQVDEVNMPSFEEAAETLAQMVPDNSEAAVQELLAEAFTTADVAIDSRYGTWNPDTGSVTPPVDPSPVTTTTIPMLDPAAMDPAGA